MSRARHMSLYLAAGILALIAPEGIADDPPTAQKKPQDPLASFEPAGRPGAGQALLAKFAGDWDVAKTFYPRQGDPVRMAGTCHQEMIHDGRFLRSEFTFDQDGKKSTGTGLIGFEPDTGAFSSMWADSRQTRMSFRQGRDKFDGETIVLYSRTLDPDAKQERRSKTTSRLEDSGRKLVHRQFSLGANGEERLVMELVLTRRQKP